VYLSPEREEEALRVNTSSEPRPYAAGEVISQKYELIRMLGEGGMGAVWVARNVALDAHVALKLIRAEVSRNVPGVHGRLLQEARAVASLGHPAIIRVFDFGTTERGDPFIAMELLHGESLAELLRRRSKVGATRAVQTLLPIVDALVAAHATGIVHRDLKPDNIFVSREAGGRLQPKVLDFGIAKAERSVSPHLTREGTVLGSPAYMSPEQARGNADVDARSDIWALCVVLYQLVTGQLPFVADNGNALLWSIVEKPALPFTDLGVTEPELWTIVARGLEKSRDARWQTMADLGKSLAEWLLCKGVEQDICHASVRAQWLEPKRKKEGGDVLLSFFPSDLPAALAVAMPILPANIPITLSGHDSASGVRAASSPPAVAANGVTQVAAPLGENEPIGARRALPRWAVTVLAPVLALVVVVLVRSALRSGDARPVAPATTDVVGPRLESPSAIDPRSPPLRADLQPAGTAPSAAQGSMASPSAAQPTAPSPAIGAAAASGTSAATSAPSRGAHDRPKPGRRPAVKRKPTEPKVPSR
jgi:serine/threonine-protein kinase